MHLHVLQIGHENEAELIGMLSFQVMGELKSRLDIHRLLAAAP